MTDTPLAFITPTLSFTDLRTSTVTTTGQLGTDIHREALFEQIQIMPYWDLNDGVLKMEHNGASKGTCFKDIMMKPKGKGTSFFNQTTLIVRREVSPLNWKEINIKLFKNGGVQITGVRTLEMASGALHWLVAFLQRTCTAKPVFAKTPRIHDEQTQLINTDFSIGAKLRRDMLHRTLVETYRLSSSFESAIYQGVKTKYFYNDAKLPGTAPGHCACTKLCNGKGDGATLGACKKITISSFQTGNVIVTGGRTMEQTNEAYEFIKRVLVTHQEELLRKEYILPESKSDPESTETKPKKTTKAVKQGWIQHPCPRNVLHIPAATGVAETGADAVSA